MKLKVFLTLCALFIVVSAAANQAPMASEEALMTIWEDPDFDPGVPAVYYARVIEIPTPRWTAYEAVRFGVELPEWAPVSLQERAYTPAIWYGPE